jgi:hypothetical protein
MRHLHRLHAPLLRVALKTQFEIYGFVPTHARPCQAISERGATRCVESVKVSPDSSFCFLHLSCTRSRRAQLAATTLRDSPNFSGRPSTVAAGALLLAASVCH